MKTPKTKVCTKCGKRKKLELFHKHINHLDGLTTHCKKCIAASQKNYNDDHKKQNSIRGQEYYRANRERCLALSKISGKKYYEANKSKIKKYRDAHKERMMLYCKEYYKANKERLAPQYEKYYKANKEKRASYYKLWRKKNKKRLAAYYKSKYERDKEQILAYHKKLHNELPDGYMRSRIANGSSLSYSDIPQELIETKREHIKLGRKLRKAQ